MFVDSHCHLNFDDFGEDMEEVILRAQEQKIDTLLSICCTLEEAPSILKIAQTHDNVFCTVGVHPHEAKPTLDQTSLEGLKSTLRDHAQDANVLGIGECGLDYYYENSPRDLQVECFRAQLELAEELNLPLSIHTRDAEKETIEMLANHKVRGVIHCFSGTQWLADEALKLGFYVSFSGIVTFKKADQIRKVAASVPLDRLLLETDAPFLAPVPKRGKRNEPAFMVHTAETVAALKGVSVETLAQQTRQNFFNLFKREN